MLWRWDVDRNKTIEEKEMTNWQGSNLIQLSWFRITHFNTDDLVVLLFLNTFKVSWRVSRWCLRTWLPVFCLFNSTFIIRSVEPKYIKSLSQTKTPHPLGLCRYATIAMVQINMFSKTFPHETTSLINLFNSRVWKVYFPQQTVGNHAKISAELMTDILKSTCRNMKFNYCSCIPTLYPTAQLNATKIPSNTKYAVTGKTKQPYTHN